MEGESVASSSTVYTEYTDTSALDLTARTSTTSLDLASEMPMSSTIIPRDVSSTQLVHTEQNPKSELKCGNWRKGLEAGILIVTILVVWALFSMPTIFYAFAPKIREVSIAIIK
jgi:hypothetical protein